MVDRYRLGLESYSTINAFTGVGTSHNRSDNTKIRIGRIRPVASSRSLASQLIEPHLSFKLQRQLLFRPVRQTSFIYLLTVHVNINQHT
jgi:hypothetical protein